MGSGDETALESAGVSGRLSSGEGVLEVDAASAFEALSRVSSDPLLLRKRRLLPNDLREGRFVRPDPPSWISGARRLVCVSSSVVAPEWLCGRLAGFTADEPLPCNSCSISFSSSSMSRYPIMMARGRGKYGSRGICGRLASIDKQVLPQTLTKTHALDSHVAQDTLDRLRHFQNGAGVKYFLAPSRNLGDALYFVHEVAKQTMSLAQDRMDWDLLFLRFLLRTRLFGNATHLM